MNTPAEVEPDLTVLESRLKHLEDILPANTSSFRGRQLGSNSIFPSSNPSKRRSLNEFLRKYGQVKDLIQESSKDMEALALDSGAKKEIVMASESEIFGAAMQLKELDLLKAELESTSLRALHPLEYNQYLQKQEILALKSQLMAVMEEYNEQVQTMSLLFLNFDSTLNALETQLGV
ncbi:hypothetical protein BC829DRAFT_379756 [Chytridium lagenaria]|nr:hypothetical protein BC829DRAFT_379756 [Chytridium lagenaria]